jgi:hypothetical protein
LIHEHQVGFVNRVLEATYRTRTALFVSEGKLSAEQEKELDEQAGLLIRYLLFADEATLPGKVETDESFAEDFQRTQRTAKNGASLRDFDLETRLFKHRCSYMIYSDLFTALPPEMKQRVYRRMGEALDTSNADPEYAWMPAGEKNTIRVILRETLPRVPAGW